MEMGWWNRDAAGKKFQVHLEVFGGELLWRCQRKRHEPWVEYTAPTDDDWAKALELAENRLQRRLTTYAMVDKIRRRGVG